MHVCYLTARLSSQDGWGTYSLEIIKKMLSRGNVCTVLVPADQPILPARSGLRQFPILTSFGNDPWKPARVMRDYLVAAKYARDCDLVHCLAEPLGAVGALISGRKRPFVMSAVGTHAIRPLNFAIYGTLLRFAYRRAQHIVCISDYTCDRLRERTGLNKMSVVPLGVDIRRFRPSPLLDVSSRRPILLSVGAVKPRKGYHVTIQAFAEIIREFPKAQYLIIGDVEYVGYMQVLRRLVEENGLQQHVRFLGKVSESVLLRHYQECDLLVLTPINEHDHFEGFGLVYLEANACGKPVVGSLDCGAETAVMDNVTGFLVPQNDPQAVTNAVLKLLKDRALYNRMSAAAREWTVSMSWDCTVERLISIYEQILEQHQ